MRHDLSHAFRSLRKQPGFAVVAILTLAFGIGVNTSLFGMVSAFFLQPLPVRDAHELVLVLQKSDTFQLPHGHSFPDYLDYRDGMKSITELTGYMPTAIHLSAAGEPAERTWIELVTPGYFELADIEPGIGQFFRAGENRDSEPVLVLGYNYWQRRFGGDPAVLGRTVTINGRAFSIIGVVPEGFTGLSWAMDVAGFAPSGTASHILDYGDGFMNERSAAAWRLMGRLAPGFALSDARSEAEVIAQRLAAEYPEDHKGARVLVIPEMRARPDPTFADFIPVFAVVFTGMVGLVLFIACANVANLMLSRSLDRQRDFVLRSALGASRWRLIRLQIVESLILAFAAGVFGFILSGVLGRVLVGFAPTGDMPVNMEQPWDWRIYAFTFLVSAVAGIATGLWPALRASRFDLAGALKEGGNRLGAARHPLRNILVIGQVAVSLVVLIASGLFLHSLQQMKELRLGFRADHQLMVSVDLGMQQYDEDRGRQFLEQLVTRAQSLPGVRSATLSSAIPFDYGIQLTEIGTDGELLRSEDGYISSSYNVVGPHYFETTGATLGRGRLFEERDDEDSAPVAIVNQTLASMLWGLADPIGKRFRFGRDGDWIEVVGVAPDGKYVMLTEEPRAHFYLPLTQRYRSPVTLIAWTQTAPLGLAQPLQELLRELDPDLPIFNLRTMESHLRDSAFGLMPMRLGALLAGVQGLIGLFLAAMGLYAVVSYAVTQRTHEIGVRMALGAERRNVVWLVVRDGMRFIAVGAILGLSVAIGFGFVLSHVLYGVHPMDLGVYAAITSVLLAIAGLACFLPARRATRVDPVDALRCE
jgi:predicted permease